jgi:transposase
VSAALETAAEAQKPARRPLPEHLPREELRHSAPCSCPRCGGALRKIADEVTETLDYVPSRFKVIRHIREKLSCRVCDTVVTAPPPDHAIARGRAGAGLLAHIVVSKYDDHLPLSRCAGISLACGQRGPGDARPERALLRRQRQRPRHPPRPTRAGDRSDPAGCHGRSRPSYLVRSGILLCEITWHRAARGPRCATAALFVTRLPLIILFVSATGDLARSSRTCSWQRRLRARPSTIVPSRVRHSGFTVDDDKLAVPRLITERRQAASAMSGVGTKRNRLVARAISGAEGRPAVPSVREDSRH